MGLSFNPLQPPARRLSLSPTSLAPLHLCLLTQFKTTAGAHLTPCKTPNHCNKQHGPAAADLCAPAFSDSSCSSSLAHPAANALGGACFGRATAATDRIPRPKGRARRIRKRFQAPLLGRVVKRTVVSNQGATWLRPEEDGQAVKARLPPLDRRRRAPAPQASSQTYPKTPAWRPPQFSSCSRPPFPSCFAP